MKQSILAALFRAFWGKMYAMIQELDGYLEVLPVGDMGGGVLDIEYSCIC